jgi:hypothetical protein
MHLNTKGKHKPENAWHTCTSDYSEHTAKHMTTESCYNAAGIFTFFYNYLQDSIADAFYIGIIKRQKTSKQL